MAEEILSQKQWQIRLEYADNLFLQIKYKNDMQKAYEEEYLKEDI